MGRQHKTHIIHVSKSDVQKLLDKGVIYLRPRYKHTDFVFIME